MNHLQKVIEESLDEVYKKYYDKNSPSGLNQSFGTHKRLVDNVFSDFPIVISNILSAIEAEVEKKLHSSKSNDNIIRTASRYFERYEDEQMAKYVRYLENKIPSGLSDIKNLLKQAKEQIK